MTPTVTPSVTPIPGSFTISLTNTGNANLSTNTINADYKIKHEKGSDIDLSKLVIRYYYTKEGTAKENFYCDTAGMQLNKDPWYIPYTSVVNGNFNSMVVPKTKADSYLDVTYNTTDKLSADSTLIVNIRFTKSDWSLYNQENDYSYGDSTKVVVYYNGKLVLGVEP